MRLVVGIVLCLLVSWLLLYLDHRAKFHQIFPPGLVFAIMISCFILYVLHGILKLVFEP